MSPRCQTPNISLLFVLFRAIPRMATVPVNDSCKCMIILQKVSDLHDPMNLYKILLFSQNPMEFMHPGKHQYSIRIINGSGCAFHAKPQNVREIIEFHEITWIS